jgi:hypothetical protein
VTAEQSLAGAMGCASWRSHFRLREHAALTGVATVIRSAKSLRIEHAGVMDLNEVGITDVVMATIWRFGPRAAAYAHARTPRSRHQQPARLTITEQPMPASTASRHVVAAGFGSRAQWLRKTLISHAAPGVSSVMSTRCHP